MKLHAPSTAVLSSLFPARSGIAGTPVGAATLAELFDRRTRQTPIALAYAFLRDDAAPPEQLTHEQLARRVWRLAAALAEQARPGDRALLVYPPGLEVVCAFWACLCAGLVPVPAPSPDPLRLKNSFERLQAISADAQATLVLSTAETSAAATQLPWAGAAAEARWIATDLPLPQADAGFVPPAAAPADLAYLQYTSGSTAMPRGVMVSHANLLANCAGMSAAGPLDEHSKVLSWLPHFHDYGLVHGIVWPFFAGMPAYLMSPLGFLRRPLRWLEAVARLRITHSGAPNFAYASCARALTKAGGWSAELDGWRVASCGAEPIHPATVEAFTAAFAPHGFKAAAFAPAYGMAEATLLVTVKPYAALPSLLRVDGEALAANEVRIAAAGDGGARTLVGCGAPIAANRLAIVEPATGVPAEPGRVGEVWLAGPSVAAGYWGDEEASAAAFDRPLAAAGNARYLRTGDLGFLHEGELYLTGRLKDLVIVRGRNHYPQDIEWSSERADPALRAGGAAAFSIDGPDGERLVIVQEVERREPAGELRRIAGAIRAAVAEAHELPLHAVALVRSGSLPRTSSGKLRRAACRQGFAAGSLAALWLDLAQGAEAGAAGAHAAGGQSAGQAALREIVARLTGRATEQVSLDRSAVECGLDSLESFELLHELEARFGIVLPAAGVLSEPSLLRLAERIDAALAAAEPAAASAPAPAALMPDMPAQRLPLSVQQEAIWFAERVVGAGGMYHLGQAVRLEGRLDVPALRGALQALAARHEALRTAIEEHDGRACQRVVEDAAPRLELVDLTAEAELGPQLDSLLRRPFDLAIAPLMRVALYRLGPGRHVLAMVCHHLVADGWSAALLTRELAELYEAGCGGRPAALPAPAARYADFVQWQRQRLQDGEWQAQLAWWRERLRGLPALELPGDRPRPAHASFGGAVERFELPAPLLGGLKQLAAGENATLFMLLLAALQTLLLRHSGQEDFAIGSPTAGRLREEHGGVLGLFTNTLVLRAELTGNPRFTELLARVRAAALQAYEHQALPSDRLLAELGLPRDLRRNALFQVGLALQSMGDTSLRLPGLAATEMPLHTGTARTDLWFAFTESGGVLRGELEYATDLYERATVLRLIGHWQVLLAGIVAAPRQRLDELPLMDEAERRHLLIECNDTRRDYPLQWCMHELIEQQVERSPEAVALVLDEIRLDYRELNRRANRLAWRLRALGVGPDVPVGVCLQRSPELVVAMLAVLKAGGAFLPMDAELPRERLRFMLEDAGVPVLLTQQALCSALPAASAGLAVLALDGAAAGLAAAGLPEDNPPPLATPDHTAYIIYTSGSTGRPKGVPITHRAMCNHKHWEVECLGLGPALRTLHKASIGFDASMFELFSPLQVGGRIVLARPGEHRDSRYLVRAVRAHAVTHLVLTPSAGRSLIEEPELARCTSLAHLLFGGEALPGALAAAFQRALPHARIGNFYGPSETTEDATHHELIGPAPAEGSVPIGRPIANMRCHVLDARLQPVPIGVTGELFIGGAGLARGYLKREALTAEKFVADPFSAGERLYRSGDLVRRLADGSLQFIGRSDAQVKLRGHRIEPGEVEAALRAAPGVRQAAVLAREEADGEQRLVAYVVGRDDDAGALREHLRERLPDYMLPAVIVPLQALPLLPSGKLDRQALPAPRAAPAHAAASAAPQGAMERAVWEIWHEVLGLDAIGVHDNFFELGGHSLSATRVVSRLRSALGIELPLRSLFEAPTIAGLAREIERRQAGRGVGAGPADAAIPLQPRGGALPVSFSQRRMWLVQQLDPQATAYNMPFASRVRGPVDGVALRQALARLVARHEALRTSFEVQGGEPVQRIAAEAEVPVVETDLRTFPAAARLAEARRSLRAEALRPFDLASGPLLRVRLLRLDEADWVLLFLMHHAIGDQWSGGILARELGMAYRAALEDREPAFAALPLQYADFAAWQREQLGGDAMRDELAFWRAELDGLPVVSLPTDHPRSARPGQRGAKLSAAIDPAALAAVKRASAAHGATPFMLLLAAFKLLLARHTGQDDIAVGTPIANRTRTATESLVGTLVNTLVMRTRLDGDPAFAGLLQRVRETALRAYAHQDLPFERLVDELRPRRDDAHAPLVQVLFNVPNAPWEQPQMPGLRLEPFDFDRGSAQFDLSLTVDTEVFGQLHLEYSTDLFEAATAQRLLEQYLGLVAQIAADPGRPISRYDLLGAAGRALMLDEWNRTARPYPSERRVDELVAASARRAPAAIAVSMGAQRLSYGRLDAQAEALAAALRERGIGAGARVGICLQRSPRLLAALLGVMKSGAAYVPLDPAFPPQRLAAMAADAVLGLLLVEDATRHLLPALQARALNLDRPEAAARGAVAAAPAAGPDDLAYLIYTSGSTGRPKGVEITHRALTNLLCAMRERPGCGEGDVLLAVTTLSFDIAALELFLPLIAGGRVELASSEAAADGRLLAQRLADCRPSLMQATPATWRMLLEAGWPGSPGLSVLCGGEALAPELAQRLLPRCAALWNLYGPTETTVWSMLDKVSGDDLEISVGRPIANTEIYILDANRQPVPIGVAGELHIGGLGLARGYRGQAELTDERFIAHPFSAQAGVRLYATGDRARFRADGRVVLLGRLDAQLKVRGFRIEPGEVEAALAQCEEVAQAAVVARSGSDGTARLVACVVPRAGRRADAARLREALRGRLPEYMLPSGFVFLEALPLTANRKIDRLALARMDDRPADRPAAPPARQPEGRWEVQLAALWRQVLGHDAVGPHDDFFDHGGHSLGAARLLLHIEKVSGRRLPLATLLQAPTVASMARLLADQGWQPPWQSLVAINPGGARPPLFFVPGVGGNVLVFARLARLLGADQPLYGLQARGLDGRQAPFGSVAEMAAHYVAEIRAARPLGPYCIAGTCTGGVVAYEMAQLLAAQGETVRLAIVESWHPSSYRIGKWRRYAPWPLLYLWRKLCGHGLRLAGRPLHAWSGYRQGTVRPAGAAFEAGLDARPGDGSYHADRVIETTMQAVARHRLAPYAGGLLNVVAAGRPVGAGTADTRHCWERLAQGSNRRVPIPAEDSGRLFVSPHVERLAEVLAEHLREVPCRPACTGATPPEACARRGKAGEHECAVSP